MRPLKVDAEQYDSHSGARELAARIAAFTTRKDTSHERSRQTWSSQIARTLALLSTTQREVLRLRLVVELSVEETVAVLGSTPEAVTVAQKRSLRVLREELIAGADARRPAPGHGD
ncbi:hypothetical protein [Kibdelosporangium aridum]|uniref:hypothetical protein n=1 Tax=Kibdelosporangium aridum TaxID=2030 RepID=UPI00068E0A39